MGSQNANLHNKAQDVPSVKPLPATDAKRPEPKIVGVDG
jgi:hypothetical protein